MDGKDTELMLVNRINQIMKSYISTSSKPYAKLDTAKYIQSIIERYEITKRSIVASFYAGTSGVPVLFDKSLFPELLNLLDEEGAKKLLKQYPRHIELVDFPEGSIDLDTPSDYEQFLKRKP